MIDSMNNLIRAKLKEIVKLQDIIKKDDLNYQLKHGKTYNFGKYLLPIASLRDIHEGYLSLENADLKQSNFAIELKMLKKIQKHLKESLFLYNLGLLLREREKVLNSFKSRLFPIKNLDKILTREPIPEPTKEPKVAKETATEQEVATEPTKLKKAKTKRKNYVRIF